MSFGIKNIDFNIHGVDCRYIIFEVSKDATIKIMENCVLGKKCQEFIKI